MIILLLSLLGAFLLLDRYALGEFGISQPIITGTIIGALFGDLLSGLFLGAMFQLIFLAGLPIGREIPPDGQAAGVIGTASYFLVLRLNTPGQALLVAAVFGLLGSLLGSALGIITRRYNEKLYYAFMRRKSHLKFFHLSGLITAFIRSLIVLLPFFIISYFINLPAKFPGLNQNRLLIAAVSLGIANGFYLFFKKTTLVYFVLGAICGLVLLVL